MPAKRSTRFEHYVPQVYLKSFVVHDVGRSSIYCYDKIKGTSRIRNIANVAGKANFYEAPGVQGIETFLGRLESQFGSVRDKLLSSKSVENLSETERRVMAYFVATQLVRTDEIRQAVRDLAAATKESLKGENVTATLRREIEDAQEEKAIREVHLFMLREIPRYAGNIMEKKWILVVNRTVMPFWTSDHPVNLRNQTMAPGQVDIGINVPGIEIYLPLSPKVSLTFCDFKFFMFNPDRMVTTGLNNIVFQNDWQLRQSTQFVFSNVNDFSLARRITEDVPEIADPNRRRVVARLSHSTMS